MFEGLFRNAEANVVWMCLTYLSRDNYSYSFFLRR